MKIDSLWKRILVMVLIIAAAAWLRMRAVRLLPIDFDEPVYLQAADDYAGMFRRGDWAAVLGYELNYEHPPLFKLIYGAALSGFPPTSALAPHVIALQPPGNLPTLIFRRFDALRRLSATLGLMNVALVAAVDPLAGAFFALHTYSIKYSSQIYLEALPMLAVTGMVYAYSRSRRRWNGWLILAAVGLGLAAASKYLYAAVGVAVVIDWLWEIAATRDQPLRSRLPRGLVSIAGWGLLSIAVFFAANPYLWPDPATRLSQSVFFSLAYQQGEHVAEVGFPLYQPFVWLFTAVPWHPQAVFTRLDGIVAAIGLIGLWRAWKRQRIMVIWWVVGMIFLLAWGTKWPQYILVVTIPAMHCAAEGVRQVRAWLPDWVFQRPEPVQW
jgi:hypothetical protein